MVPSVLLIVVGALLLFFMYCVMFIASCKYSSEFSVPVVTVSLLIAGTVAVMAVIKELSPLLSCVVAVVSRYRNVAWFTCTPFIVISVGSVL